MLAGGGMDRLPRDPRKLREWAMVMSVVGSLTAIDRPLIPAGAEVLIPGSGAYSEGEFESPIAPDCIRWRARRLFRSPVEGRTRLVFDGACLTTFPRIR